MQMDQINNKYKNYIKIMLMNKDKKYKIKKKDHNQLIYYNII